MKSVLLTASDSTASEPHNIYYLPGAVDNGTASAMTFPPEWISNSITLSITGTATINSDYSLSTRTLPAGAPVTLTLLSGNSWSLFFLTGVTQVFIDVVPIGDLIETDSGETAIIATNPSTQSFTGGKASRVNKLPDWYGIRLGFHSPCIHAGCNSRKWNF